MWELKPPGNRFKVLKVNVNIVSLRSLIIKSMSWGRDWKENFTQKSVFEERNKSIKKQEGSVFLILTEPKHMMYMNHTVQIHLLEFSVYLFSYMGV